MATARRRLVALTIAAALAVMAVLAAAGGAVMLYGGFYNAGATQPHFQWVHSLLEIALHRSVRNHARDIATPASVSANANVRSALVLRGAGLYRDNCLVCHGAPGVAQGDIGKSMQPIPGPLSDAARHWKPNELYWITRHGIKMSGMPAWQYHLADQDIWAVVAFLTVLPALSPAAYDALAGQAGHPERAPRAAYAQPDIERGRLALTQYACNACHQIPGVTGPATMVGPPLHDMAKREYIAGRLPNNAANLARWIQDPQRIHAQSAMPGMGVTESDARDIAAYLLKP
ncbi:MULTISPECIES: c-type cytochrome [unclassified Duganella]|uniref:c-type cytochrome n=1 Tax=unclassified Duganella TaxID=2636909 RepID=UPI000887C799|nr:MULTISPECIES: c-type cytochrome [unclassified Duganella]SDF71330.1 Cytochrome c [Duganella sp. OV458]SDI58033.1 Cytochrome c [Duganella sp. OV510]